MRLIKYVLLFFLFIPLVSAQEITVLYFYNSFNVLSQETENQINSVKDYWSGKVIWKELDYANQTERIYFERYNIFSLPVAVVECYQRINRVNKSVTFADNLNESIIDCNIPRKPTFTQTTETTVIGKVGYPTIRVEVYGGYIFIILAIILAIFVYRFLRNRKAG